jgi:hypothetical protein
MRETVTVRRVLELLLAANSYPRQGNTDWDHAKPAGSILQRWQGPFGAVQNDSAI